MMVTPDLSVLGPRVEYTAIERTIMSGRAFVVSHEFASVLSGDEVFIGLEVDADHYVMVWSVSAGSLVGAAVNSPGKVVAYAGEVDSGSAITPINMISSGDAAAGFTTEYGTALVAGAVAGDGNVFALSGQNILNGARGFGPSSKAAVGVTNKAATAATMIVSVLMAVFDKTTVEDVEL